MKYRVQSDDGLVVPTVRLKGKWLQAAGLAPGQYVTVTVISPGVIELRLCGQPEPDGHYFAARIHFPGHAGNWLGQRGHFPPLY